MDIAIDRLGQHSQRAESDLSKAEDLVRDDESSNRRGIVPLLVSYSTRSPLQMAW